VSDAYEKWKNDGTISTEQALRALCADLGEVESELEPLKRERDELRKQIGEILVTCDGYKMRVPQFGTVEITEPSIVKSYDREALDELLVSLAVEYPDIAAAIRACRKESSRAGSLRITRAKQ
jgi:hypothetical protein